MKLKLTTAQLLKEKYEHVLETWKENIRGTGDRTFKLMTVAQFEKQTRSFMNEFITGVSSENYEDITRPEYENLLKLLRKISASRAEQGFSPTETGVFILSFKKAVNKS